MARGSGKHEEVPDEMGIAEPLRGVDRYACRVGDAAEQEPRQA